MMGPAPEPRRVARDGGFCTVEMAIGIALVVISAVLILGIVRVVSANLNIGR